MSQAWLNSSKKGCLMRNLISWNITISIGYNILGRVNPDLIYQFYPDQQQSLLSTSITQSINHGFETILSIVYTMSNEPNISDWNGNIPMWSIYPVMFAVRLWRSQPAQAGLTIALQSRINREPIADFIDMFWTLKWSGLLDCELCFSDSFSLAITHCWTQCLGKPEYSIRLKCNMIIMPYNIVFSSYNSRFCYNKCLSQSRTNRRSIAMQGFTVADVEIHMPFPDS